MSAAFPSMQPLHIVTVLSQAALLLCLVTLQGNCWTEDLVIHNVPDAFSFILAVMWDCDLCHTQISRTACSSPLEQPAWPAVELFLDHASSYSVSFGIVLHLKTLNCAKKTPILTKSGIGISLTCHELLLRCKLLRCFAIYRLLSTLLFINSHHSTHCKLWLWLSN